MNIFVPYADSKKCAEALDDLRLNKMILETAQLLSTAAIFHGYVGDIYKSTHLNHPCSVWTRETRENYNWLFIHMQDLVDEKFYRTGKIHGSVSIFGDLCSAANYIPYGPQTPFANCTPHKSIHDVHLAYRCTLTDKWAADKRPPKWTKRQRPF